METYRAPDPTPEMTALAKEKGYDPNNLGGSLPWWDLAPDDTFAAASLLHDLGYIRGGSDADRKALDERFYRDTHILADATSGILKIHWEQGRGAAFRLVVEALGASYWHSDDWNTEVTRAQAAEQEKVAKKYINAKAEQIQFPHVPYPEVE
jgi:hypothetical protein